MLILKDYTFFNTKVSIIRQFKSNRRKGKLKLYCIVKTSYFPI